MMPTIPLLLLLQTTAVRGQAAVDVFDPNANGAVRVVVVQPDGKILIGGRFTMLSPNGGAAETRHYMARLNPDGSLDTAFNPGAEPVDPGVSGTYLYVILSIAVQADGKILVGGSFTSVGGQTRNGFARLDATTGLADSFDPNPNNYVGPIVVHLRIGNLPIGPLLRPDKRTDIIQLDGQMMHLKKWPLLR
jgi:hypothetical protein